MYTPHIVRADQHAPLVLGLSFTVACVFLDKLAALGKSESVGHACASLYNSCLYMLQECSCKTELEQESWPASRSSSILIQCTCSVHDYSNFCSRARSLRLKSLLPLVFRTPSNIMHTFRLGHSLVKPYRPKHQSFERARGLPRFTGAFGAPASGAPACTHAVEP